LRIAVCGGSGRVGATIVLELVKRGHTVLNLDQRPPAPDRRSDAKYHYVDLTNRAQFQSLLEGCDAVIQLAEIPHHQFPLPPDKIYTHNIAASTSVLQACVEQGIKRVLYTSTCQVYGCWDYPKVPPLTLPMDETHPTQAQNIYALAKVVNEQYCHHIARQFGLSVAIFRLPWVLPNWDKHVTRWMERGADGPMEGFGTYIATTDIASAYALAAENPRPGCEIYNCYADEVWSAVPIRERLAKYHPEYPQLPTDWPDYKSPVSNEKLKAHFGWRPEFNARQEYFQRKGYYPRPASD
jgi:UDP-glucose 4-epimerase